MPRRTAATLATSGEVLRLIRTGEAVTRADLGRVTGLSRPAVQLRVGELLDRGLVVERADAPSTGGRPPVRLEFNAVGGVVLVAALGASRNVGYRPLRAALPPTTLGKLGHPASAVGSGRSSDAGRPRRLGRRRNRAPRQGKL